MAEQLDVAFVSKEDGTGIRVMFEGDDVSLDIRQETIGKDASLVAMQPQVRDALLKRQRAFAQMPGVVADGRDMGTVVFPGATVKVYLTASSKERAKRRVAQLESSGLSADFNEILAQIEARDKRDMEREVAPLVPADDAVILDTTELTIAEVVAHIIQLLP